MIPWPGEPSGIGPGRAPVAISELHTGVTLGNEETQSVHQLAAVEQRAEVRRVPRRDRAAQHVHAQRVDDDQAELAGHPR